MPPAIEKRATKVLVESLVSADLLELEGDPDDALARLVGDAATWLAQNARHPRRAELFGNFLERHPSIGETYADEELLAEKLAAWDHAVRRFATPVAHRNPALEQQILDNLDDDSARLVYGDWLQQQGDPLGELVVRQASDNARAAKRLLAEYGTFFFGPAEEYMRLFKAEYHLGFIRSITLTRERKIELEWPIVVGWLLERPIARFVEHVQIGPIASEARNPEAAIWDVLVRAPRPALRTLGITAKDTRFGEPIDLAPLEDIAPRLQELRIEGMRIRADAPLAHPALTRLVLAVDTADPLFAACVEQSSLPALVDLTITTRWGSAPRIWPRWAPALRVLRLDLGGTPSQFIVHNLVGGDLLAQLAELELAGVDRDAGQRLLDSAPELAHLAKLVLVEHDLSAPVIRALRREIPGLEVRASGTA